MHYYAPPLIDGALSDAFVWRLLRTSWIFMAPTATRSKARWAPQARHKACMGWSWAAACGAYRGGGISWRPPAYSLLCRRLFALCACNACVSLTVAVWDFAHVVGCRALVFVLCAKLAVCVLWLSSSYLSVTINVIILTSLTRWFNTGTVICREFLNASARL